MSMLMASAAKKLAEHSQGMRRTKARTQVGQAFLPVRLFSCHLSEDRQECLSYTVRPRLRANNPSTSNPCPAHHRLLHAQGYERVDASGAARGKIASQQRDTHQ